VTLLVRTEGKIYQSGYTFDLQRLLSLAPLEVSARDATARSAEHALGLRPSLYFYVGHACPAFGTLVFVYELERMAVSATASDHDTGGLHAGFIHFDPPLSVEERLDWSKGHQWLQGDVSRRTQAFVQEYFNSFSDYCTGGRPTRNDEVGRLLHPLNERRSWSIEVRLEADHPLTQGLRLIGLSPPVYEAIRDASTQEAAIGSFWEPLLDSGTARSFDPSTMHREIEGLIARGALP
jgi:hypothetical protein